MSRKRKVACFVLTIVLIYHIVWFLNYTKYIEYSKDYKRLNEAYLKSDDMFVYTIAPPKYPSFIGNFSITLQDSSLGLIIWPSFFNKTSWEFGIIIFENNLAQGYQVYVDNNMKYQDEKNYVYEVIEKEKIISLIESKEEYLKQMKKYSYKEWGNFE